MALFVLLSNLTRTIGNWFKSIWLLYVITKCEILIVDAFVLVCSCLGNSQ